MLGVQLTTQIAHSAVNAPELYRNGTYKLKRNLQTNTRRAANRAHISQEAREVHEREGSNRHKDTLRVQRTAHTVHKVLEIVAAPKTEHTDAYIISKLTASIIRR